MLVNTKMHMHIVNLITAARKLQKYTDNFSFSRNGICKLITHDYFALGSLRFPSSLLVPGSR